MRCILFPVLQDVALGCNLQLPMRLVHGGRRGCRYAYEKNILQTANLLLCFDTYKSMETCAALQHTPLLNSERARGLRGARLSLGRQTRGGGLRERGLRLVATASKADAEG